VQENWVAMMMITTTKASIHACIATDKKGKQGRKESTTSERFSCNEMLEDVLEANSNLSVSSAKSFARQCEVTSAWDDDLVHGILRKITSACHVQLLFRNRLNLGLNHKTCSNLYDPKICSNLCDPKVEWRVLLDGCVFLIFILSLFLHQIPTQVTLNPKKKSDYQLKIINRVHKFYQLGVGSIMNVSWIGSNLIVYNDEAHNVFQRTI
jgi:hypothetical protein